MNIEFNSLRNDFKIFFSEKDAVDFGKMINLIKSQNICLNCSGIIKLRKKVSDKSQYAYRCINNNCKKWYTISKIIDINLPKISISKLLFSWYNYSIKASNYQQAITNDLSEHSVITIKNATSLKLKEFLRRRDKIGGPGVFLQIDETACNRRRIISCPTTEEIYVRGTIWVIGIICESSRKLRLAILPDRSIESINSFFKKTFYPDPLLNQTGFEAIRKLYEEQNVSTLL
ncbi:hypothetical protein DMUE_6145 [Dictyocoela muelleri]|nr:hypothetical protein DMUE_6145 [Dictyocoela muelleri]